MKAKFKLPEFDVLGTLISDVVPYYKTKIKPTIKILSSQDSFNIFKQINDINQNIDHYEMFYAMYLNRSNMIVAVLKIGQGGLVGAMVDPKIIMQNALMLNACAIVLCHNHPSGNKEPSDADKGITKKIQEICNFLDMNLLDHIIIAGDTYFSFDGEGLI